ncbi:RDD family protein [Alteribacillus sp. HJP-4]|uniref:RDD family protein n=1 Tax=Alteribacillus sp. HJP-4 TaxID=2775394 RepID=UPI0035CCD6AC
MDFKDEEGKNEQVEASRNDYPGEERSDVEPSKEPIASSASGTAVAEGYQEIRYAGFWMRFWAYIIDLIVVFSVNGLLTAPFLFLTDGPISVAGILTVQGITGSIAAYVYFVLMTKFFGQTLGKMLLGLKVVRKDALPLRWTDLLFREVVGRFIYRSLIVTNILYVVVGFTDQKQGIHDIFADTRVIHSSK